MRNFPLSGCKFGDRSKMLGFPNSWAQLPTPSATCPYQNCNEICYCNSKGEFQQCHVPPPQPFEGCRVGGMRWGEIANRRNQRAGNAINRGNLVCEQSTAPSCRTIATGACAITANWCARVTGATTLPGRAPSCGVVLSSRTPCAPLRGSAISTLAWPSGKGP